MKEVAKTLLDIQAVSLSPNFSFTWASGIQAPVYCDNRLLLSYPDQRKLIIEAFINEIKNNYPDVEVLAGTATAGIPHAAFLAHELNLPMVYVRSKPKEHGKQNLIEGKLTKGAKVLVIEDLISTGKSSLQVVNALKAEAVSVMGVLSIFTYDLLSAKNAFQMADCNYKSLTNFKELLEVAREQDILNANDLEKIYTWTQSM
ncbi:MAG: orotate phosphoribosyltransferase [Bdellovibrionales bacterium]|nr:orotate phosphoribosyltransferase [Bdellovibrionales bacterium]